MLPAPVLALYAASVAATGTGVALALRERGHWPVAGLFAWGLTADVVGRVLRPALGWYHPLHGGDRVAFHVAQAGLAGYPLAVLGVAAVVLGTRWLAPFVAGASALYLAGLAFAYGPLALWDGRLASVYAVAQAVVVLGLLAVVVAWGRALRRAPRLVAASELCALWLAGVEVINLFGPYLLGFSHWATKARAAYGLSYVVISLIQGGSAWRRWGRSAG